MLVVTVVATGFIKIATALAVFRYGVGLHGIEFGIVSVVVAVAIAFVSIPEPLRGVEQKVWRGEKFSLQDLAGLIEKAIPSIESKIDPGVKRVFEERLGGQVSAGRPEGEAKRDSGALGLSNEASSEKGSESEKGGEVAPSPVNWRVPAFVVSEVKAALALGMTLLVPFLLMDLLVAHVITLLGITSISVATVSLPLKLMVFLSVNGWELFITKVLS